MVHSINKQHRYRLVLVTASSLLTRDQNRCTKRQRNRKQLIPMVREIAAKRGRSYTPNRGGIKRTGGFACRWSKSKTLMPSIASWIVRPGRVLRVAGLGEACFHADSSAPLASTLSHERATLDYPSNSFAGVRGLLLFSGPAGGG